MSKPRPTRRVYFAHPISTYGTPHEKRALRQIRERFPGWEIINPGDKKFSKNAMALYPITGMALFDLIASKCDALVALPLEDFRFGAGVYSEMLAAARAGAKIYGINPELPAFGGSKPGKPRIYKQDISNAVPLSISETRRRVASAAKGKS